MNSDNPGRRALLDQGPNGDQRLNAATRVLWRSGDSIQLELGQRRLVIDNVGSDDVSAILPHPVRAKPDQAVRSPAVQALAAVLHREGFLADPVSDESLPADRPRSPSRQLPGHMVADLNALESYRGNSATSVLRTRREAAVKVHGTSRLAASTAATLAAAGVGWVQLVHGGDVRAVDACPGGLQPADEGRRFAIAAADAVRRAAPDVDTTPIPGDRHPDLTILTDPGPVESSVRASLHLDGLAHLSATVSGAHAVVGPLVLPGVTSCLRCGDLSRTDRDPAWPALAVQLSSQPRRRCASDVSLCVATSGVAASQALTYLDGGRPATLDGTLEWLLPDWRLRRRSWPAHPHCDCGAAVVPTARRRHGRMGS